MFKQFAIFGVLAAALAALSVPAQAHYVYTFSGWLYHSVQCDLTVAGVQSDNTRRAKVACSVVPTKLEVLCQNPEGKIKPGQAYFKGNLVLTSDITDSQVDASGKFSTSIFFTLDVVGNNVQIQCLRNWTPVQEGGVYKVFIREFDSELRTYVCLWSNPTGQCNDPGFDATTGTPLAPWFMPSKVIAKKCTISNEYGLNNPPPPGTPFLCNSVQTLHLD